MCGLFLQKTIVDIQLIMVWFLRFNRGRIWFCSANFPNWGNTKKSTCQIAKSPALPKRWTENSRPSETPNVLTSTSSKASLKKKNFDHMKGPSWLHETQIAENKKMRTEVISIKGCIQEGLMGQYCIFTYIFFRFWTNKLFNAKQTTANVALSFCTTSS